MTANDILSGDRQGKEYSLAFVVDMWLGVAAVAAMTICGIVQYLRYPDQNLGFLLSHHVQELLLLGFVFWGVSWIVFRIALVSPLQEVFRHLYRIGGGDRSPVKIRTQVREIRNIAESINVMLWRLDELSEDDKLSRSHDITTEARALLDEISNTGVGTVEQLHDLLEQVQMLLRQATQNRNLRRQRSLRYKESRLSKKEADVN